jgi:hypothetical protein
MPRSPDPRLFLHIHKLVVLVTKKVGDLSLQGRNTKSLRGEALPPPFTHSPQPPNGNSATKPHNAATIYRREQRGLSIFRDQDFCEEFKNCRANA